MLDLTTFERHRWRDSARNGWICAWLTTSPRKWSPTPDPTISDAQLATQFTHTLRSLSGNVNTFCLVRICLFDTVLCSWVLVPNSCSELKQLINLSEQTALREACGNTEMRGGTTIRSLRAERRYDNAMLFTSRKVQTIGRPWNWLSYVVPLLVRKLLCKLSFI